MRLDFFLLADAATAAEGKLYVHGGAITTVNAGRLPWTHPQISYVFRLMVEPGDDEKVHDLQINMTAPNGHVVIGPIGGSIPVEDPPDKDPDQPTFVIGALSVGNCVFEDVGTYHAQVVVNGEVIGSQALTVRLVEDAAAFVSPQAAAAG